MADEPARKSGSRAGYAPERGDNVWLEFTPQAGHEQAGRRPALIVSAGQYNRKVGLALCCPITNQIKGYPFEVIIPSGLKVSGAILADQIKSLDWRARRAQRICVVPDNVLSEVISKIAVLLK